MITYEITEEKQLRITENDNSLRSIGRILFIVAGGTEYILADNAIVGYPTIIRTELLNSHENGYQVRGVITNADGSVRKEDTDENFNVTMTWDTIRTDNGKDYHRPGSAAALQAAA